MYGQRVGKKNEQKIKTIIYACCYGSTWNPGFFWASSFKVQQGEVQIKSTFNLAVMCSIYLDAVSATCSKQILEIHPGQGMSDVPHDFSAPGRLQEDPGGLVRRPVEYSLYYPVRSKMQSSCGDLHYFIFLWQTGRFLPLTVVLPSSVLGGRGRCQIPKVCSKNTLQSGGLTLLPSQVSGS